MTCYDLATRYIGIRELAGNLDHPLILWWLSLTTLPPHQHDETSWCSAFVNGIAWELDRPRTQSAAARSWLKPGTGRPVSLAEARPEDDVVVLQRGDGPQPGPDVLDAPGHVGFFSAQHGDKVWLLGGNQGDQVCLASFPVARVLGVRRLTG